jgi:hypothetical protein
LPPPLDITVSSITLFADSFIIFTLLSFTPLIAQPPFSPLFRHIFAIRCQPPMMDTLSCHFSLSPMPFRFRCCFSLFFDAAIFFDADAVLRR